MSIKPTVFFVTDIETTLKKRTAFDVAWKAIDRKGREYGSGSFLVLEAFKHDVPYFKEKLGHYFSDTYRHLVKPLKMDAIKDVFNSQVDNLMVAGHKTVFCAYNAAFDTKYLGETSREITGKKFLETPISGLLDIWDYWGESVPLHYSAEKTASGKFLSTSAESAYRFEFGQPEFVERHIAHDDVEIESDLLLKTIARKKAMPIVSHPSQFTGAVWKKINQRLGVC